MKRIFVFLLVAIAAISLSAVSAAEDASADVNTLTLSDDGAVVSDVTNGDNATVENNLNTTSVDVKNTADNESDSVFEENKVISSSEDENTVTNSTFFNFFDNTGVLRDNITSSDLIFKGNFTGLNVNTLTINKSINILGQEAILENMGIVITANDVSVSDLAFNLMNNSVIKSAIEITRDNVTIFNNFIAMESAVNENSFAINAKGANNLTINNNSILYLGRTNGTVINSIIYLIASDDVSVLNNTILAKLPSVPVAYTGPNYDATVMSVGIYADGSSDLNIESNNVTIEYENSYRYYDTIYALYVDNTNNAVIENNRVNTKGHTYVYGLHIGGKNINITLNDFNITSDNNYANGIEIADESCGIVGGNEITLNSPIVTYGIYSSSWGNHANNFTYMANEVVANSSFIYAMYLSGNNENLINNVIKGNGNFTIGVASDAANLTLNGNNILINGTNIGSSAIYETISPETAAVKIIRGNATISENIILVNGAEFEDSFAIHAENADNLIIDENAIGFEGKTNGTGINNAIRVINSDNVNIENNNMIISIPSVSVYYDPVTWEASVVSEGICVDGFTTLNINSNSIVVEYNNASGVYDTVYALDINGDNAVIENNNITTKGHKYTYGINIAGENITINSNNITSISDNNYANAIQIQKDSTGVVNNNIIVVESPIVVYGIYSSDYSNRTNNITYMANEVVANSSFIYAMYLSGNNENLINNVIKGNGNFTIGVASDAANLTLNGNNILVNGTNIGGKGAIWESITPETAGVKIVRGNATISENMILVNGAEFEDSFAIHVEKAGNLIIDENAIGFEGKTNGTGINNAIRVINSDNVNIENNNMYISIPSVSVQYDSVTYDASVVSEGIYVDGFTTLNINSNSIVVEYNDASGFYNTVYALDINGDNAVIENNDITTKGHRYVYGINIAGENITISSNIITSISDDTYANAIQIQKGSTGIVNDNMIVVESPVVAYGIYSSDYLNRTNNITYVGNDVTGNSSYIYGIYVSGHNESLIDNFVDLTGNFTTDIASSADILTVNNNTCNAFGNNIGDSSQCGDSIVAETTGIKIVRGNATVINSTIISDGDYAVNTTGAGSVTYNYLVANVGLGDNAVSANNKTIVENNMPNTFIKVPDLEKVYGTADKLVATLIDAKTNPIANATITFNINGQKYNRTTNASGIASMAINLYPGIYEVVSTYNNNSYKSFIKVTSSIVGNDIVKIFQNGTQFYATFYDKDGKTLANNTDVSFNINGVFYTRQTNENGTAKLTINLRPGNYTLTAINPANDEQRGFNVVVLPNIETKDLVKYYKNESQFVVKVLNKNGTPANGTNITFNINGVIYTRAVTDGYAKLTINLAPGKYTITTSYEGYEVGNSVIVNPTLITKDLSMNYKDGSTFNATVLDGQGNPLANQVVTFNVNGVFYNRTSGDDGIASLNINLNKGEYLITSMWNNYQVGNKITII